MFGAAGLRVGGGRIESGAFELRGRLDGLGSARFVGSFNVRERAFPRMARGRSRAVSMPTSHGTAARISATVSEGRTGDFDLESVDARWDAAQQAAGPPHGPCAWPLGKRVGADALETRICSVRRRSCEELAASGDALFGFVDVTLPGRADERAYLYCSRRRAVPSRTGPAAGGITARRCDVRRRPSAALDA